MKNLIISTTLGFMIAIATPALSSEIEDYAGLPLDDYSVDTGPREAVFGEEQSGYDGLPVTRRIGAKMRSAEIAHQEGYDGLPLVGPVRNAVLAVQE